MNANLAAILDERDANFLIQRITGMGWDWGVGSAVLRSFTDNGEVSPERAYACVWCTLNDGDSYLSHGTGHTWEEALRDACRKTVDILLEDEEEATHAAV